MAACKFRKNMLFLLCLLLRIQVGKLIFLAAYYSSKSFCACIGNIEYGITMAINK